MICLFAAPLKQDSLFKDKKQVFVSATGNDNMEIR